MCLPGRENRINEPHIESAECLLVEIARASESLPKLPLVLLGHSMGAGLAFAFAVDRKANSEPLPLHLFVSGSPAPPSFARAGQCEVDDATLAHIARSQWDGLPESVCHDPEVLALALATLRADLRLLSTIEHCANATVHCPITALGGADDASVARAMLEGWRARTHAAFDLEMFPGRHMFITTAGREVAECVVRRIWAQANPGINPISDGSVQQQAPGSTNST